MNRIILVSIALLAAVTAACSSMTAMEKDQKRNALDEMAATAITELVANDPEIQTNIDNSLAYAVANMKVSKVPLVGAGGGEGVFVDNKTGQRAYFTVSRFDVGGGWGLRSFKVLLTAESQEIFDRLKDGTWEFQAGAEVSAGTASAAGSSSDLVNKGFTTYVLSDGGASATVTARVIRTKVNRQLTDSP